MGEGYKTIQGPSILFINTTNDKRARESLWRNEVRPSLVYRLSSCCGYCWRLEQYTVGNRSSDKLENVATAYFDRGTGLCPRPFRLAFVPVHSDWPLSPSIQTGLCPRPFRLAFVAFVPVHSDWLACLLYMEANHMGRRLSHSTLYITTLLKLRFLLTY